MLFHRKKAQPEPQRPLVRYLVSAAGVPNYGDEFITRSWLHFLARREPTAEVWLDCIAPGHAALLFAGIHPNLHIVNTAWQLVWDAMDSAQRDIDRAAGFVRMWMENLGSPREDLGIVKMREADSIHFLGGGYINGQWPQHTLLAEVARLAKVREETKLIATGLGIAPMGSDDLARLRTWLDGFDHVEVRDQASASLLGIAPGHDDAFLCLSDETFSWHTDGFDARLLVCLQQDVVGRHPEAVPAVVETLLASDAAPDEPLALVESIAPEDCWALGLLREAWQGEVRLVPFMELWQGGLPFREDAIWVTTRFHMHLLGAASGARGAYLDFDNPFYATKHGSLAELGTGWTQMAGLEAGGAGATARAGFVDRAAQLSRVKLATAEGLYEPRA